MYNSIETNDQEEPRQAGRRTVAVLTEEERLRIENQEGAMNRRRKQSVNFQAAALADYLSA